MREAALLAAVLALLAAWPFFLNERYVLHIAFMAALFAALSLSMNLLLRTGMISLAQAAFMGIGAYVSALSTMRLGLAFPWAFLAAGAAVALLAAATGPVFLRIKGVYFILLTLALSQVILLNFAEWVSLTGGNGGLSGIPRPDLFGIAIRTPRQYYLLALALAAVSFVGVRAVYRSSLGTIIDAINEDDRLASSLGLDSMGFRVLVFCMSGFLAGLCGSLYAHYMTFVSPDSFAFETMIDVILINVFGGVAAPIGPVVGAVLLIPLPELLRGAQEYQVLSYAVLLIALQLFLPDGLVGLVRRYLPRARGRP